MKHTNRGLPLTVTMNDGRKVGAELISKGHDGLRRVRLEPKATLRWGFGYATETRGGVFFVDTTTAGFVGPSGRIIDAAREEEPDPQFVDIGSVG